MALTVIRLSITGGGPGLIPVQSIRNLQWTKWRWGRVFSQHFGLPCRYISTGAPCSSVSTCPPYQKDTLAKPGYLLNSLTPNDPYRARTAPLTSKSCISYIYSTNIGTEYFKHGIYSPCFSLQKAVSFIILTYLVPVLFTFYTFIQQIQVPNILNMVYALRFFSSKSSFFHNSNVFGSRIINILYIYSTNIGTEYFKHGIYSPFFS